MHSYKVYAYMYSKFSFHIFNVNIFRNAYLPVYPTRPFNLENYTKAITILLDMLMNKVHRLTQIFKTTAQRQYSKFKIQLAAIVSTNVFSSHLPCYCVCSATLLN